jgi:DNA mismatch repair protein MutL
MSRKIQLLPDHVIDKIAAGEVIENPASVVKELVENALDAGATRIQVEIKGGGHQLLRISDNGCGMSAEDAKLSLSRHATSKIRTAEDLFQLHTMGFRGEALSSIASISKLTMTTSTGDVGGTRLEVEGGKLLEQAPCARAAGTTMEVRSLFYNVPARRAFQKAAAPSSAEISRTLTQLALSHPDVAFDLTIQDQVAFSVASTNGLSFEEGLAARAFQLLGEEFSSTAFVVSAKTAELTLTGLIGAPSGARKTRGGQYLFINRRAVFSPIVSYAVKDAYSSRIEAGRHPTFVLHLTLPTDRVDVNVHPQKKEVRLSPEKEIKEQIEQAIRSALISSKISTEKSPIQWTQPPLFFSEESTPSSYSTPYFSSKVAFSEKRPQEPEEWDFGPNVIGLFGHLLLIDSASLKIPPLLPNGTKLSDGLLLVHLDRASSRLAFDSLKDASASKEQQLLTVPLPIELPLSDAKLLLDHSHLLEEAALSLSSVGKGRFLIHAIPSFLSEKEIPDLIAQIVASSQGEEIDGQRLFLLVSQFSKVGKKQFTVQEALALFEALLKASSPYLCPRGNPTMAYLNKKELDELFVYKKNAASAS